MNVTRMLTRDLFAVANLLGFSLFLVFYVFIARTNLFFFGLCVACFSWLIYV